MTHSHVNFTVRPRAKQAQALAVILPPHDDNKTLHDAWIGPSPLRAVCMEKDEGQL